MNRRRGLLLVLLLVGALLALAGCGGGGGNGTTSSTTSGAAATSTTTSAASTAASAGDGGSAAGRPVLSIHQIYEQDGPGVAFVQSRITQTVPGFFGPTQQHGIATGSGIVVDDKGDIVTNAHVVLGASHVTVQLGRHNQPAVPARIAGIDVTQDLAVLKVDPSKVKLDPIPLGDSSKVVVGQPVVAIGNPFGLDNTVTSGIVSALQREINSPKCSYPIYNVIQTDAAINPGNSGGPLLDRAGQVIGVNSQIATAQGGGNGNIGIGFAIPISTVKRELPQLEQGNVEHAYLGAELTNVTSALAQALNLGVSHGALIESVRQGGPAAKAGLHGGNVALGNGLVAGGDVIVSFGGQRIATVNDLIKALFQHKPGDHVRVGYYRHGHQQTTTVTLGNQPKNFCSGQGGG